MQQPENLNEDPKQSPQATVLLGILEEILDIADSDSQPNSNMDLVSELALKGISVLENPQSR